MDRQVLVYPVSFNNTNYWLYVPQYSQLQVPVDAIYTQPPMSSSSTTPETITHPSHTPINIKVQEQQGKKDLVVHSSPSKPSQAKRRSNKIKFQRLRDHRGMFCGVKKMDSKRNTQDSFSTIANNILGEMLKFTCSRQKTLHVLQKLTGQSETAVDNFYNFMKGIQGSTDLNLDFRRVCQSWSPTQAQESVPESGQSRSHYRALSRYYLNHVARSQIIGSRCVQKSTMVQRIKCVRTLLNLLTQCQEPSPL